MVPPDLTKKKSGVAAGQARVEEFKRKEREAKVKAEVAELCARFPLYPNL